MAYYQNAPKKRTRVNYGDTGSWDEEGTHYHDREGRKNARSGDRQNRSGYKGADHGYRSTAGQSGGNRRNEDYRESSRSKNGRREVNQRDGRSSNREYDRSYPRQDAPQAMQERQDYRDFEYRRPTESFHNAPASEQDDRILCGRNPIREALRSGRDIEKLLVQKGELSGSAREIVMEAREKKIMVQEVDKRRLDEIALHHQGLIAFASAYAYAEVEDILAEAERKQEDPFIVILDGVTDPHNLGAVIRTAECVGAHGVIIPLHRSVGLTPAAVKASAGAIEHMKVARVTNLNRTIEDLKRQGVWTYAMTMDGKDYEKVDFHGGTALVIGAEGEGISRLTAEKCDLRVSLPLRGKLDSLNASVAAGVMMYRVLSCRRRG